MTEKQFDVLTGLSRNMEKSLGNIEKSLGASVKDGGKATNVLAGLSQSLGSLVSALSVKKFDSKKANTILEFSEGLVKVANSVDPKSAKAFGEFASGISAAFETLLEIMSPIKLFKLHLATKILFEGKNPMLKRIAVGMSSAFGDMDPNKAQDGAKAIKYMGEGLLSLTKALKSFILIGLAAPLVLMGALVVKGVIMLFSTFGEKAKDIEAGGKAIKSLGKGMTAFSAGLATLLLVTVIGAKLIPAAIAVLALFGLTFWALGKAEKSIRDGAKAVAYIGLAIFGFSAALAMFMLVLMIVKPEMILLGMAIIAAIAIEMYIIGKFAKEIATGALLLIGMAVALFLFSAGLMVFGLALKLFSIESLLMGAVLITEIGLAMFLLGKFKKQISEGALVMAEMGVGLGMLSVGLLIFGVALKLFDVKSALLGAGIITGLGIAFGIVGQIPGVAAGAISMLEIGATLITLSGGLLLFGLALKVIMAVFKGDLIKAGEVAGAIILGLGLAFGILGATMAGPIAAGAVAMIGIGAALIAISVGILIFALAIKALLALFKGDLMGAGKMAGGILVGLGGAFAVVGLMSPAIILGSVSVLTMGASLIAFSVGLLMFGGALTFLNSKGMLIKKDDSYELKGIDVLTSLAIAFSEVGVLALTPMFWLGINASIGMGISLAAIGVGLFTASKALEKVKDMGKLIDAIFGDTGLIPSMADSFAKIGKKYGGTLLSSFLGADDVSMGVRVTNGFGTALQDVAGGIVAFADFTQFPVKVPDPKDPSRLIYKTVDIFGEIIPKLNENLPILLSTLSTTFATIGAKYGSKGFLSDSPVQKGVDAIKGMGSVLSELAGGIVAFANFEQFPIQLPNPKDPSKLIYGTVNLMDSIPKIKTALLGDGKAHSKNTGILFALANTFAYIGEKYGDSGFMDGPIKKGVDAVKGIGGVISELANGIIAFASMDRGLPNYDDKGKFNGSYTPFKLETVRDNIVKVLQMLPSAFDGLDLDKLEAAKEKADAAKPLADSIAKIGKSLQSLMVDKGKGEKVSLVDIIGPALKKFTESVKDIDFDNDKLGQLERLANSLDKFSRMGSGLKEFAKALGESGKAFRSFAKGFGLFSTQIDKFARFENSFSNLVRNQYTYKFDQFSKSMGTLKDNVNEFNVENLKMTDSLMKSLAILSKSPDVLGETIKESIEAAMTKLAEAMKELSKTQGAANEQNKGIMDKLSDAFNGNSKSEEPTPVGKPAVNATPNPRAQQSQQGPDIATALAQVTAAINSLNSKFTTRNGGIVVTES